MTQSHVLHPLEPEGGGLFNLLAGRGGRGGGGTDGRGEDGQADR